MFEDYEKKLDNELFGLLGRVRFLLSFLNFNSRFSKPKISRHRTNRNEKLKRPPLFVRLQACEASWLPGRTENSHQYWDFRVMLETDASLVKAVVEEEGKGL
jgi:hypothetical protein